MSGYVGNDAKILAARNAGKTAQLERELELEKARHRPGPRNRAERRAAEAKLKKRMAKRSKNIHEAIRTGRAQ